MKYVIICKTIENGTGTTHKTEVKTDFYLPMEILNRLRVELLERCLKRGIVVQHYIMGNDELNGKRGYMSLMEQGAATKNIK